MKLFCRSGMKLSDRKLLYCRLIYLFISQFVHVGVDLFMQQVYNEER